MKCPTCYSSSLVITERAGVEIDYCPQCRGVWLDRGELDKLVERARAPNAHRHALADREDARPARRPMRRGRKSWLSEIFD